MQLLESDYEIGIGSNKLKQFQTMYHPIWQNKFRDVVHLQDGKFVIDNSPAARKVLAQSLNDNIFMNIEKYSVLLFD